MLVFVLSAFLLLQTVKSFSSLADVLFMNCHWSFFFFFACTWPALCSCLCTLLFSRSVVFTLCNPTDCSMPGFPVSRSLLKLVSIESEMPSNHLILCHPTSPFALQSFPASGSFPVSQLFSSGGQSIGTSASASILPMNIQGWFPLGLTGFIFALSNWNS